MSQHLPERKSPSPLARAAVGCLLGTAVGDALGLPYEGLAPRRARRAGRPGYAHIGVVPRNALFLAAVLCHGFRRLAPPY